MEEQLGAKGDQQLGRDRPLRDTRRFVITFIAHDMKLFPQSLFTY
jgi:hypothetical protein